VDQALQALVDYAHPQHNAQASFCVQKLLKLYKRLFGTFEQLSVCRELVFDALF
jgi:hypothetical protein